jgi:hypothetical protein
MENNEVVLPDQFITIDTPITCNLLEIHEDHLLIEILEPKHLAGDVWKVSNNLDECEFI